MEECLPYIGEMLSCTADGAKADADQQLCFVPAEPETAFLK